MSLFDVDDDTSSSSSLSCDENAPGPTAPGHPDQPGVSATPNLTTDQIRARMGLPGHYTVTAADAAQSAQRQRQALERRLAATGAGPTASASDNAGTGRFGNSIAAALQLRREDQEQLLRERIQRQREQDANTPELVEKDLEVGTFVTPAYKQILKQHHKAAAQKTEGRNGSDDDDDDDDDNGDDKKRGQSGQAEKNGDDDDDDALEAYLKQFSRPATSADALSTTADVDFYTTSMRQAVREAAAPQEQHQLPASTVTDEAPSAPPAAPPEPSSEETILPPSLDELQSLLGLPGGGGGAGLPETLPPATSSASASSHSPTHAQVPSSSAAGEAAREHQATLFRAREARRRKRADDPFIAGCAQRCDTRILRSIRLER